jgi:AcrR family transcriptional regulator
MRNMTRPHGRRHRHRHATPERILRAAFEEFTKRGFEGARIDEIASRADCNKALIYRHYRHKEDLFKQVLESKLEELGRMEVDPERLAEAAGEFFDFHAANPWLTRLLQWEALDFGSKTVPNEDERSRKLQDRVDAISAAQKAGHADPNLEARQTLATLMGMVGWWFAFPQTARMIAGGDPYSPEALKRRRAHIVDAARKLLEVR